MLNLTSAAPLLQRQGFWGPVTATLDWCEINYQFSPYVAEVSNAFSNLFTIALALRGLADVVRHSLPTRYAIGYMGVILVGLGSLAFHATLQYGAQLADELPMIYVGSMSLWLLLDNKPGFGLNSTRTKLLIVYLALFDALFTWSYYVYRNPLYHQAVFASVFVAATARIAYILKISEASQLIPKDKRAIIARLFSVGAALFAFGFFIWNIDNIYCYSLTRQKVAVGWPLAFLLEGHSWWHLFTGAGVYYMFIGIQYVTLCVKDHPQKYTVIYERGIPYVRNVQGKQK